MKILMLIVSLILFSGCSALTEWFQSKPIEEQEQVVQTTSETAKQVIETTTSILPVPAPIKYPIKEILEYAADTLILVAFGALGYKGTRKTLQNRRKKDSPIVPG